VEDRAFAAFYEEEYRAVLALARVLTGDRRWAEDVAQDVFVAALAAWPELQNPAAWVRTVAINKARSGWRRRYAEHRALRRFETEVVVGRDLPPDVEGFWEEVRGLPRRQAQAIALFYLEDRPVSEIAGMLDCSESTARVHLTRGRRALAERLAVELD
jgi:RNA polymerase sigma-70 factor (ECF subfamily)